MFLNRHIGLHVRICLYVCAHSGCVSEERRPVIHSHFLDAISTSHFREKHYSTDCSQKSVNQEDFNAKIVVQNDNRSSQILSIAN